MIITLEDSELEVLMASEESEANLTRANESLKEIQAKEIQLKATLNGDKMRLLGQIERLESERKATLPPIPPADLTLYEHLRIIRNGVAVVNISSRACTACGATLSAAIIQSSQSTGQIVRCPTCGRILYPG